MKELKLGQQNSASLKKFIDKSVFSINTYLSIYNIKEMDHEKF